MHESVKCSLDAVIMTKLMTRILIDELTKHAKQRRKHKALKILKELREILVEKESKS